jgi:hypothetical protein
MKITQEDGSELEVFTKEELDEQLKGYVPADEVEKLKEELAKKEEASKNNAILRKKAEEAEKNKGGLETEFNSYKEETEKKFNELSSKLSEKEVNEYINSLTDDKDVVEKIKVNLKRITGDDTKQNVLDAYKLSVDNFDGNVNFVSAAGAGASPSKTGMTQEAKEISKMFGITEEDIKKYAN